MTFQEMQQVYTAEIRKLELEEMQAEGNTELLDSIRRHKNTVLAGLKLQRHWIETGRFELHDVVPGSEGES